MVNFIQNWLDYNYGPANVEHRFFVHDSSAYEVTKDDFYNINNEGGTQAAPAFELVSKIAVSEYDPGSTNFYGFYYVFWVFIKKFTVAKIKTIKICGTWVIFTEGYFRY